MRLRPRQKRPSLRNPQVVVVVILVLFLFNFLRWRKSTGWINVNQDAQGNNGPRDLLKDLTKFVHSADELFVLKDKEAASLVQDIKAKDAVKLSVIAKAQAGTVRQALIEKLEPDKTKRILLALLARQKNGELHDDMDEEDADEDVEEREEKDENSDASDDDDVKRRILADMTEEAKQKRSRQMSMDSENKWRPLPQWALDHLERNGANPLNRNCSTLYVPDHEGKYGGFTADCGWMIMSMVYAMENGACAEFPELWGHGCDDPTRPSGWTCFFKPVQQREYASSAAPPALPKEIIKLRSGLSEHRKMVRRDTLFKPDFEGHRYPRLNAQINEESSARSFELDWNADLLAWRLAFRWAFRPNDKVRKLLDDIEKKVLRGFNPEDIAGAHLRFGDKLGLRPGPREAYLVYQVKDFAERLVLFYAERNLKFPKAVFVATDDYNASVELGRILGPSVTVLTSADPVRDQGFSIVEYRKAWTDQTKFDAAVRLWADMEILSRTQMALLSFQSNIGRTVTLMRFEKPANTTISVDPTGPRCSKENRIDQLRTHNFWLCP